ncbi:MAG: TonB-dependent receptor [Bradyrhizobium sp.]|nr:TonB-dependent receptor [Bradyrhizobium sp.]
MRARSINHRRLCSTAAAALVFAAPVAAHAQQRSFQLDIPAQDMGSALKALASATGQQVVFKGSTVRGKRNNAVRGSYSPEDAVALLIRGTGLASSRSPRGVIVIAPAAVVATAASQSAGEAIARSDAARDDRSQDIVVTGTNIRGIAPVGSPLTVYTKADLQQSGAGTLEQFARTMPENFASADASAAIIGNTSGGSFNQASSVNGGSGFNLNGLGSDATLTLLNGHRLAPAGAQGDYVDISLIPFAAIDRIEVLKDGSSAIYGADAIAGVVNILLRHDFHGAESSVRYGGATDGGAEQITASQLLGTSWASGNVMAAYEFDRQYGLLADQRSFVPDQGGPSLILPKQRRNSVFVAGRQELGNALSISGEGYFSDRSYEQNFATPFGFESASSGTAKQYGGNLSLKASLGGTWVADITGSVSRIEQPGLTRIAAFDFDTNYSYSTSLVQIGGRADGQLGEIAGGAVRLSVGGEYRQEKLSTSQLSTFAGAPVVDDRQSLGRNIASAYGELFVPLIGSQNASDWAHVLELSLAARYDRYSDFGSALNPKLGVRWVPTEGVTFRASFGTSFRPPLLPRLISTPTTFVVEALNNPAAPGGTTITLLDESQGNPNLKAQKSRSFTAGFDLSPADVPGLKFNVTYFNTRYRDRIATPPIVGSILDIFSQTAVLAPFFDLNPDPAAIAKIFQAGGVIDNVGLGPGAVQARFDFRPANIAVSRESGLSISASYHLTALGGTAGIFGNLQWLFENSYQAAVEVPAVELLNRVGQPLDLRLRTGLTYARGAFDAGLTLNHVPSYSNDFVQPADGVSSWTTLDLYLGYKSPANKGPLRGIRIGLTATNLGDASPPFVQGPVGGFNIGYDPANASPVGRVIAIQVTKQW